MQFCLKICAILTLAPFTVFGDEVKTENSPESPLPAKLPHVKLNLSLSDILNPSDEGDEKASEEKEVKVLRLPKLTIWEFPSERRAFLGDVEIFIQAVVNQDDTAEVLDPETLTVHHTDKHPEVDKTLLDEKQYPAFRPKKHGKASKKASDSDLDNVRGDREKRDTDLNSNYRVSTRNERQVKLNNYLNWLLGAWDLSASSEDKSNDDTESDLENGDVDPSNEVIDQEMLIDIDALSDDFVKMTLQPLSPELARNIINQHSKLTRRGKRAIESRSSLNSLIYKNDNDNLLNSNENDNIIFVDNDGQEYELRVDNDNDKNNLVNNDNKDKNLPVNNDDDGITLFIKENGKENSKEVTFDDIFKILSDDKYLDNLLLVIYFGNK